LLEPERVSDHQQAAGDHRCRCPNRVEPTADRQADSECVVDQCPEQILPHDAHGPTRQDNCPSHPAEIVGEEAHIGTFARKIGTTTERDPHVGGGERRCVVQAVTYHDDTTSLATRLLDDRDLLVWE
jgi:hypothetical protein